MTKYMSFIVQCSFCHTVFWQSCKIIMFLYDQQAAISIAFTLDLEDQQYPLCSVSIEWLANTFYVTFFVYKNDYVSSQN